MTEKIIICVNVFFWRFLSFLDYNNKNISKNKEETK
jgi:hypothetical protein